MLTVTDVELRVGARLLMDEVNFRVDKGDKVGLVGRNGAGKTTLTKVLAGDLIPADGKVERHRDYFDAGALLYQHVPLLGSAIRWLQRRLA